MKKIKKIKMLIGYYKPSVIVTYLGIISGVIGITFGLSGKTIQALICLIISGICDAFDGKIARACTRTKEEKEFGIQIDSLADTVSFVVLPTIIFYGMGLTKIYHIIIYTAYILAGVIRLAYFNVKANESKEEKLAFYSGLPVTSSAIIFPVFYILKFFLSAPQFSTIYTMIMAFTALLFVLNFKLKKPDSFWAYIFLVGGIVLVYILYRFGFGI